MPKLLCIPQHYIVNQDLNNFSKAPSRDSESQSQLATNSTMLTHKFFDFENLPLVLCLLKDVLFVPGVSMKDIPEKVN
jgi:hypothetical protein